MLTGNDLKAESPGRAARRESRRILMLSIVNPVVEHNGASTVTRGLLALLALPPFPAEVDCIPARAQPVRWRRFMQARSLLRSATSKLPSKAAFLYSKEFRERVAAQVRSQRYDLVILNGTDLLWISAYIPKSIPLLLVALNLEHQLFCMQIQHLRCPRWPLKALLHADCRRLERYEWEGMRQAGNVLFRGPIS